MKRRKFLAIAGLGTAAATIPVIGFSSTAFFKQAITSLVQRDLNYLKLDKEGLEKFSDDFSNYINSFSFTHAQKIRAKAGYEYLLPSSTKRSDTLDYIVSSYLLGTDFFINKMDESKVVKYMQLYDPYKMPCVNPFNHLYYKQ